MKRLPVFDLRRLVAYLKANYVPTPGERAAHGIEDTEDGLIHHDKHIAALIGLSAPQFSRALSGDDPLPAKAASRLLQLFGLETPDTIDSRNSGHDPYRELLLLPAEQFFTQLRLMGADVPCLNPGVGEPWSRFVRVALGRQSASSGTLSLYFPDRVRSMPPMRCMPQGVPSPIKARAPLDAVRAGERLSYCVNLGRFSETPGNAIHLWAFHAVRGLGEPQFVPLLPAPWSHDAFEGPVRRARAQHLGIPQNPDRDGYLVVPKDWGPTIDLFVVATRQPLDDQILESCRMSELIAPETLDRAAALLLDEHEWPVGSWLMLRTSFNVVSSQGEQMPAAA